MSFDKIHIYTFEHLMMMLSYLQAQFCVDMESCARSVSVCRGRAIVSTAVQTKSSYAIVSAGTTCFKMTSLSAFHSLRRVRKRSGAGDRPEVHHRPGCDHSSLDGALPRSPMLSFLVKLQMYCTGSMILAMFSKGRTP